MPTPYLPTAAEVAALTVLLIRRYADEKRKETTRFRLARTSLRRMAIRASLRDALVDEWSNMLLLRHGWIAAPTGDEFILVHKDAAAAWVRLGTKRLNDIISRLRSGDRTVLDDVETELNDNSLQDEVEEE